MWAQVLTALGGGTTVVAILQAVRMLRQDNTVKARKAVADMERWRSDALADAAWYLDLADYWRGAYGDLEFAAKTATALPVTLPERLPLPQRPAPRIQEI